MNDEPSFRKFTASVRRGVDYLIVAAEFDGSHDLVNPDYNGRLAGTIAAEDILAAGQWLRYERDKREKEAQA